MKRLLPHQMLKFITHGKAWKAYSITINLKYQLQHRMINLKLPDGSYSVSNIEDYFEYILKMHGDNIDKPSVEICVNKTTLYENRITFKIKNG